jgi:hypothetical protein
MRKREGKAGCLIVLGSLFLAAGGSAAAAEPKVKAVSAGLSFDHFTRTVVWKGDESSSRILSQLVSARAEFGTGRGLVFSLSAGLSLADFKGLAFGSLPISLEYGGAPIAGLALGAEILAPLHRAGDFEIIAAGRFVSSFGMSKTWPLEGFAVEGEAKGRPGWMEASIAPRAAYLFFDGVVPYLEVSARWFRAGFRMEEALEDLAGEETKRVTGDLAFGVALGVDAEVTERIAVRAKAGIMPFTGGVDGLVSIGVQYRLQTGR